MHQEIIHIGFSKSASTFLQSIFSNSDEIIYKYKSKRYSLIDKQVEEVHSLLQKPILESDEHIVLPSWHPELQRTRVTRIDDLYKVFSKIKSTTANPKIIMVVRDQKSLILSRYSQFVVGSGGFLDLQSFIRKMLGEDGSLCFYENYYGLITKMLFDCFGQENVHVMFYEDLKLSGKELVQKLNHFTGLNFDYQRPKFKSQRKGLSARGLKILASINKILVSNEQPDSSKVRTRIPHSIYSFIIKTVRVLDSWFPSKKLALTEEQLKEIENKFYKDNQLLAQITGRDIKKLGYSLN